MNASNRAPASGHVQRIDNSVEFCILYPEYFLALNPSRGEPFTCTVRRISHPWSIPTWKGERKGETG